ncbi:MULTISPECIES: hypothetical protein [unclassified Chryseobacterium]|nr:hypothetical protein DRF69_08170 [Chryseobacterium sp. 5_R23647]
MGAPSFLENYKVYISTTGNQVANFTTILKTVTNESVRERITRLILIHT